MTDLRKAAEALCDAWEANQPFTPLMDALRAALAAEKPDPTLVLIRAQTACVQRHREYWDEMIPDHDPDGGVSFTREQIDMARTVLAKLAREMDECDPHVVRSEA